MEAKIQKNIGNIGKSSCSDRVIAWLSLCTVGIHCLGHIREGATNAQEHMQVLEQQTNATCITSD